MTADPRSFSSLRKLAGHYPDIQEFMELMIHIVQEENDRAAVLASVSLLDGALKALLLTKLKIPNNENENYLFGPNTPLRPLSAKIKLGYALNLYGPLTLADLEAIREVRNCFAHSMLRVDFKTQEVINVAKRITYFVRAGEKLDELARIIVPANLRNNFDMSVTGLGLMFAIKASYANREFSSPFIDAIAL